MYPTEAKVVKKKIQAKARAVFKLLPLDLVTDSKLDRVEWMSWQDSVWG